MTFKEINDYARQLLRDVNRTIFQEIEINRSINEGIDRCRQIKELQHMKKLEASNEIPQYLPEPYHHLLSLFSASRCFFQDEQMQQSVMLMNEFENKLFELKTAIENGDVQVFDPQGNEVVPGEGSIDYVANEYFKNNAIDNDTVIM